MKSCRTSLLLYRSSSFRELSSAAAAVVVVVGVVGVVGVLLVLLYTGEFFFLCLLSLLLVCCLARYARGMQGSGYSTLYTHFFVFLSSFPSHDVVRVPVRYAAIRIEYQVSSETARGIPSSTTLNPQFSRFSFRSTAIPTDWSVPPRAAFFFFFFSTLLVKSAYLISRMFFASPILKTFSMKKNICSGAGNIPLPKSEAT